MDLFHLQLIKGDITNTLNDLKSQIGHVQVSGRRNTHLVWMVATITHTIDSWECEKRLISEQYLIFFPPLLLQVRLFFSLFTSKVPDFVMMVVVLSVFMALLFVVLYACSSFFVSIVAACLFFGDVKVNLCYVYYTYLPVFGTWQVGRHHSFDLILRNFHLSWCACFCCISLSLSLFLAILSVIRVHQTSFIHSRNLFAHTSNTFKSIKSTQKNEMQSHSAKNAYKHNKTYTKQIFVHSNLFFLFFLCLRFSYVCVRVDTHFIGCTGTAS